MGLPCRALLLLLHLLAVLVGLSLPLLPRLVLLLLLLLLLLLGEKGGIFQMRPGNLVAALLDPCLRRLPAHGVLLVTINVAILVAPGRQRHIPLSLGLAVVHCALAVLLLLDLLLGLLGLLELLLGLVLGLLLGQLLIHVRLLILGLVEGSQELADIDDKAVGARGLGVVDLLGHLRLAQRGGVDV
jgi:hypothetical protein